MNHLNQSPKADAYINMVNYLTMLNSKDMEAMLTMLLIESAKVHETSELAILKEIIQRLNRKYVSEAQATQRAHEKSLESLEEFRNFIDFIK